MIPHEFTCPLQALLLPYQLDWVRDQSRLKIALWARQTGKDFSCAAEAVHDCVTNPGAHWLIVAAGERQALESFDKAKTWARLFRLTAKRHCDSPEWFTSRLKGSELRWPNGSRLTALPASPGTVRGYSANVILTEFAFHSKSHELWRALYPSISNPLRGGPKKLRIVSTPNGEGNMFHELWHVADGYSRHKLTIHEAVEQGLPLDIQALREGLADSEGWLQEYECEFLNGVSALLPLELIAACESDDARADLPYPDCGQTVLGIDFGRKRDLTVCWTLNLREGALWTTEVLALERTPTPDQLELLRPRIERARAAAVDYTGPGIGLGDLLAREFGERQGAEGPGKIELCTFTQPLKNELFSKLRLAFEQRRVKIPSTSAIREDLRAMQRVILANGGVTYRAAASGDGHSDRATALALAIRAAGESAGNRFGWQAVPRNRARFDMQSPREGITRMAGG